jgi:hypothetical protein
MTHTVHVVHMCTRSILNLVVKLKGNPTWKTWAQIQGSDFYYLLFSLTLAAQRGWWPPRSRGFVITHNDAPQYVGFLWTSDQLVAETSTWQHITHITDKHPCLRWNSNQRSQQASGRIPTRVVSSDVVRTHIHNILSTAPQLSISQKALWTLPEDGNVMPKHVGATIHTSN